MSDPSATATTVSGWTVTASDLTGPAGEPVVEITKGERTLIMVHEPGMDPAVVHEYATTRSLEAEVEDAARALCPDAAIRDVMTALWEAPPADPATESAAVRELRTQFARDEEIVALRHARDSHVGVSRAKQIARGVEREGAASASNGRVQGG